MAKPPPLPVSADRPLATDTLDATLGPQHDGQAPELTDSVMDRPAVLAALKNRIARLERANGLPDARADVLSLCAQIDMALPSGGLDRAALHEVLAEAPGAAAAFCALVLARAGRTAFWIGPDPDPWPPGMAQFGLDPARLVLVRARKPADALWAAEEALRCPAVGAVLLSARQLDLTAARRLMLAAATGGGIGLLLRPDDDSPGPTAAITRWRIGTLPGSGAARHDLGDPRWRLTLLRARGGRPQAWTATWHAGSETLGVEEETAPQPHRRKATG